MINDVPIFERLFPDQHKEMPPVFLKHYGNRIGRDDKITAAGTMDIWRSPLMAPISFLFRWSKTLLPVTHDNAPTSVVFRTRSDVPCFWFDRKIGLQNGAEMRFLSRMEFLDGNKVIEWTGAGVGWKCAYSFSENRVHLSHLGYRLRLGRIEIPLRFEWLFGRPTAWEEAIDETRFRMEMKVSHKIFGTLYSYAGQFEISEITFAE